MTVREILLLGNPLLRATCEQVRDFSDVALRQTIEDLHDTLADFRALHSFGRGIAAPQIGVAKRIVFINIDRQVAMINPKIFKHSREVMTLWDDCFSFPDLLVKVKRHVKIAVHYHDTSGQHQQLEAEGGLSELLQHEIDHVNGILAVDRAIDSRHIVLRSEWEKMKQTEQQRVTL